MIVSRFHFFDYFINVQEVAHETIAYEYVRAFDWVMVN
jgi:hypothetical protein